MTRLIFGCGYLGGRVARRWLDAGQTVYAVASSQERAEPLAQKGLRPIVADVTRPETLVGLPTADTVLYAVGYDPGAAASRRQVHVEGLRAVLEALPAGTGRIIYVSSTGVYGDRDGRWVDEDSPCRPTREGGQIMLAAERVLLEHPLGARAIILRLAGLYGPGRIPRTADLEAGRPMPVPSRGHLNLIHVEDAATAVIAAVTLGQPPRVYTVSDGHPVGRREFYAYLAQRLGLPVPAFIEPVTRESAGLRATADKRVRNQRMLRELKVALSYPSYREGLDSIAVAGSGEDGETLPP